MDTEQDLVVFSDDDGHELTLEILDYFFYNGQEYAVLTEAETQTEEAADQQDEEEDDSLYIMQVVQVDDEMEEFIPVEEELMDTLIDIVMTRFDDDEATPTS